MQHRASSFRDFLPRRSGVPALVLCGALAGAVRAGDPPAFERPMFPTEPSPREVAVVDVDRDGRADIVTAHYDELAILLAQPDGTFGPPSVIASGNISSDMAAGDVNGDGLVDLLMLDGGNGELYVHLGLGGAQFAPAVVVNAGVLPESLDVADLDGDGTADVALVNGDKALTNNLWILRDFAHGGFQAPVKLSAHFEAHAVAARDVTLDGIVDLVVVGLGYTADKASDILPGLGGGAFGAPMHLGMDGMLTGIEIADLNADGRPDVLCGCEGLVNPGVFIALAKATGGFKPPALLAADYDIGRLVALDLNRDGRMDLVTEGSSSTQSVSIHLGNGNGTFAAPQKVIANARCLVAHDMDADGFQDLVLTTNVSPGFVSIWSASNDVSFGCQDAVMWTGSQPFGLAAADLDADGRCDLVEVGTNGKLAVRLADALGGFAPAATYSVGGNAQSVLCVDLDADGDPDLVVTAAVSSGSVKVLLNAGDGSFVAGSSIGNLGGPLSVAAGDVDGDGDTDLCTLRKSVVSRVQPLWNDGAGNLSLGPEHVLATNPLAIELGNVVGDGALDAVLADTTGQQILVLEAAGDGTFLGSAAFPIPSSPAFGPTKVRAADVDADGLVDVVVRSGPGLYLLRGAPGGGLSAPEALGVAGSDIQLASLDDDGDLDLVVATSAGFAALLNDGAGHFALSGYFNLGSAPDLLALGDFDADGSTEVALGEHSKATIAIAHGSGGTSWADLGSSLAGAGGPPHLQGVGAPFAGHAVTFKLAQAAASGSGALLAGVTTLDAPFKGGTIVPKFVGAGLLLPIVTTPAGELVLPVTWPAGVPVGTSLFLQVWLADATGPVGYTASNAIVGVVVAP